MTPQTPQLRQFRLEFKDNGLVHLVFDAPGLTMNVFSDDAIVELGVFAHWLAVSDARGALIRSGKQSGFCAGANLPEIWASYDMVTRTPPHLRFTVAFDHFFRMSLAMRALETCGKPVAAALAGLALGGGCELALAAHYRVLVDDPRATLGLPESLVGLLPGAGGTQRLPRLIGVEAAMPILLDGARLSGRAALEAGLVDALVAPGEEIAAAEAWLLSAPAPTQPWDRVDWIAPAPAVASAALAPVRREVLAKSLGHYPALFAILDCVEFGLPQGFEGAIRSEMAVFAHLIMRPEPRNMIQTQFLGRVDYDRLVRKGQLPAFVGKVVAKVRAILDQAKPEAEALAAAGFTGLDREVAPVRTRVAPGYWVEGADGDPRAARALAVLDRISEAVSPWAATRSHEDLRIADYAVIRETGYPAYLGGPFAFGARNARKEPSQS